MRKGPRVLPRRLKCAPEEATGVGGNVTTRETVAHPPGKLGPSDCSKFGEKLLQRCTLRARVASRG